MGQKGSDGSVSGQMGQKGSDGSVGIRSNGSEGFRRVSIRSGGSVTIRSRDHCQSRAPHRRQQAGPAGCTVQTLQPRGRRLAVRGAAGADGAHEYGAAAQKEQRPPSAQPLSKWPRDFNTGSAAAPPRRPGSASPVWPCGAYSRV